jgi:hypothetical protein
MKARAPSGHDLAGTLGSAQGVWDAILAALVEQHGPIDLEWKPSKADFGWICLLKHGKRTLVYLTPEQEAVTVAVVLGERAVALALASALPDAIKALIREARPYAEGRGIRFLARSLADVPVVRELVAIKTTPK